MLSIILPPLVSNVIVIVSFLSSSLLSFIGQTYLTVFKTVLALPSEHLYVFVNIPLSL